MPVQNSPATPARGAKGWRTRLPVLVVVTAVVAGVVAAVTGATANVDAMRFLPPGHWVFNSVLGEVFHIDGATSRVDASGGISGDYGDRTQVVQGDSTGYVVGDSRITVFGKSDLQVVDEIEPAADEEPVGLEVAGGPYLVYRDAGKVTRFGEGATTMSARGPVGDPVATSDGTLWLPRRDSPFLCVLRPDADSIDCPVVVPGDPGPLSVVADRPVFVDPASDMLHPVEDDGLGQGRELGVDVPKDSRVAPSDVGGRIAILDPGDNEMHLVDAAGLDPAAEADEPIPVDLGEGEFDGPVSTGDVVAVMDTRTNTLTTYDRYGKERDQRKLTEGSAEDGDPRLSRGQDRRIYVDGADGEHVLVVDRDGEVTEVPVRGVEDGGTPADDSEVGPPTPPTSADPPERERQGPDVPRREVPVADPSQDRRQQENASPPPVEDVPEPPPLPASPPGVPPGVSAAAGDASATVTWGAAPDNRAPITRYTVSWTGAGGQPGSLTTGPGARSARVTGLANGVRYVVTVSATNSAGTGPGASAQVTPAVPVTPPGRPGNLDVAFDRGARTATLTWTPPPLNGGTLSHYLVGVTGMPNQTVSGVSTTLTNIPGPAGELTFTVRAVTTRPGGGPLTGEPASRAVPDPAPRVTISRGPPSEDSCAPPHCAWMTIVMTGFAPNTEYHVYPRSSDLSYENSGARLITDENGYKDSDRFEYAGVGDTVWVVVELDGVVVAESNRMTWEAG